MFIEKKEKLKIEIFFENENENSSSDIHLLFCKNKTDKKKLKMLRNVETSKFVNIFIKSRSILEISPEMLLYAIKANKIKLM